MHLDSTAQSTQAYNLQEMHIFCCCSQLKRAHHHTLFSPTGAFKVYQYYSSIVQTALANEKVGDCQSMATPSTAIGVVEACTGT